MGTKAHGLAVWDKHLLLLDSEGGALVRLDTAANQTARLWQVRWGALGGGSDAAWGPGPTAQPSICQPTHSPPPVCVAPLLHTRRRLPALF